MDLLSFYNKLYSRFGPRGWWPGDSSHEHFVGCILAQNTRWDRVVPVIERMKSGNVLNPVEFVKLSEDALADFLKGSGTYRRKALYLGNAGKYMLSLGWDGTPGSVTCDTGLLRQELLSLNGIGQETCDCILLYVLERPVFVVDAYTKRILCRHKLCGEKAGYSEIQKLFHSSLHPDVEMYKEYHALLVECAKQFCRPVSRCIDCPLNEGNSDNDNQRKRNTESQ
jgi:endonuclease-3 related protein